MTKLKENKVLIIGTIIFIVLLIFFLSIRCEKINIGSNKHLARICLKWALIGIGISIALVIFLFMMGLILCL